MKSLAKDPGQIVVEVSVGRRDAEEQPGLIYLGARLQGVGWSVYYR